MKRGGAGFGGPTVGPRVRRRRGLDAGRGQCGVPAPGLRARRPENDAGHRVRSADAPARPRRQGRVPRQRAPLRRLPRLRRIRVHDAPARCLIRFHPLLSAASFVNIRKPQLSSLKSNLLLNHALREP